MNKYSLKPKYQTTTNREIEYAKLLKKEMDERRTALMVTKSWY